MAQKTVVELIDDIDGSEAAATVHFSLDGVDYEIDLSAENADKLRAALAEFVEHAREAGRRTKRPSGQRSTSRTTTERDKNQLIREWARKNGRPDLSDRGRLPAEVRDAYNAAHPAA